jgi:Ca-activated chloride channel family protein
MDKLKQMLSAIQTPEPEPEARQKAVQSALVAFDSIHCAEKNKGEASPARLIGQKPSTQGGRPMTHRYLPLFNQTAKWGAVCALLLVGVAVMVPHFLSHRTPKAPWEQGGQRKADTSPKEKANEYRDGFPSGPRGASRPELKTAAPAPEKTAGLRMALDSAQPPPVPPAYVGRDRFEALSPNPIKRTAEEPVSTFSIDVDTASYAFVRRALNSGFLPPQNAVRIEELINYFTYDYPVPKNRETPFKPTVAVFPTPWNPATQLLHIGIKGYALEAAEKPRANLVFLVDVSGSMQSADKLPLLKNALRLLVDHLAADDSVAVVTYAGRAGTALEPTRVREKGKILAAIDRLEAGGSTAGAEGIVTAYDLAQAHFDARGVNRVVLATDGDFNVGISDPEQLKGFVERQRRSNIYLSVLGFGQGNYNDALMQKLAQNGNGNAAYIDTLNEARKVLVEEASATLFPIAKDVKIQVEFNPAVVAEYRLIGYETRLLRREDFANDKVDSGDVGAGHSVTALYEIVPTGGKVRLVDDLRYGNPAAGSAPASSAEFGFLKIGYKLPDAETSQRIQMPIDRFVARPNVEKAPGEARFAAAVAAFGQLLRGDPYTGNFSYDDVIDLAQPVRGADVFGHRSEFVNLVRLAKTARAMGDR